MSTGHRPARRNTRPYVVDESTIRRRCATPDAAEYTLYVRSLIDDYLGINGQSQILRNARIRRLDFPGLSRQKLSEQLSRYRLGPTWEMVELIIGCLPDSCDTSSIRALAAGWYQCARGRLPDGYTGPVSRPAGKPELREVPDSGPNIPALQRRIARMQDRSREDTDRYLETLRRVEQGRQQEMRRADELERRFHQTREELLGLRTIAAEVATIREEYARQCVTLELIAAPGLRAKPVIGLPALPTTRRRVRFGHLVATIDPQAPPARRALARYLCVYAEFAGVSARELAARANIDTGVMMEALAGQILLPRTHIATLTDVLGCDPDTLRHLTTAAGSDATFDESFWKIAARADVPPPPDAWIPSAEVVGTDPDNPATRPHTTPTPQPAATITNRLRQLADLHQQGLITGAEHAQQRARILGEL